MPEKKPTSAEGGPNGFQPKIVAFFCNWCTYLAADLAGTSRMKYAPNVRVIRVMCSGRVDPQFVLDAFAKGADGVEPSSDADGFIKVFGKICRKCAFHTY